MKSLANRVALVTGGAGGIGSAICEELAAFGATVKMSQAWRHEQAARTPLKRLATPQEIARAVAAMATSLTFATGVIIPIDGGRPLG